jgi:hypothetical protein
VFLFHKVFVACVRKGNNIRYRNAYRLPGPGEDALQWGLVKQALTLEREENSSGKSLEGGPRIARTALGWASRNGLLQRGDFHYRHASRVIRAPNDGGITPAAKLRTTLRERIDGDHSYA